MANLKKIEAYLERCGWTRRIAGDADFNAALLAIETAADSGLGLIVSGEYGVGKTKLVSAVAAAFGPYRKISLADSDELIKLTRWWMEMWSENLFDQHVFLDDIGAESSAKYSNEESVVDFLNRFELHATPNARLFATTNLSSEEIDARYGGRFYSRLKPFCVPLKLTGQDKRQWVKPTAR